MQFLLTEMLPDSRLFLAVLLHFIWQATIIVSLVAISRSLIHPRFFQARYILSVVGLFAVLLAPIATAGFYLTNTEALQALNPPTLNVVAEESAFASQETATSWLETQFQVVFFWFDSNRVFWLGCWFAGFVLLVMRLGISLGHCIRIRRGQKPLPPHLQKLAGRLKAKLNITRNIIVASSQEITQAVATGVIKPVVLVPAAWITQLPVSAIEAVLAHELAHVKRWDLWINLLQRFTETVFFFHPLVWWLSRQISSEREVCCDQLAIKATGQPIRYVETLAHVAGTANTFDDLEFQFGTAFVGGKKMNLLRRAKMILEPTRIDAQSPVRALTLMICVGLIATCGSYAYCLTPEPGNGMLQEEDHVVQEIRVRQHESDSDGTLELIVIGEGDHQEGDFSTDVLHRHLAKILHDKGNHGDHAELARQLRELADQLEAGDKQPHSKQSHSKTIVRRNKPVKIDGTLNVEVRDFLLKDKSAGVVEVHPAHDGTLHLRKLDESVDIIVAGDGDAKEGTYKVVRGKGGVFHLRHSDAHPNEVVEFEADSKGRIHTHDVEKQRVRLRKKHDPRDGNVEVDVHVVEDHGDQPHPPHSDDMQFGHASTSDQEIGEVLRQLKNEIRELRQEVKQIRSGKAKSATFEWIEKGDTGGKNEFRHRDDNTSQKSKKENRRVFEFRRDNSQENSGKKDIWVEKKKQ